MVEKVITLGPNVVDFARYQQGRNAAGKALAMSARRLPALRRGAVGRRERRRCSSAFNIEAPHRGWPRKFYAD